MATDKPNLDQGLSNLKIDRSQRRKSAGPSKWATRWILAGVGVFVVLGLAALFLRFGSQATEVDTFRVSSKPLAAADEQGIVLNAAGYIVAHHKIQLSAKVIGKV